MNLDLSNNLFNGLKEKEFMQNFMKELSNYLENNVINNLNLEEEYKWNNLLSNDLTLYDNKIIAKYRDEMLIERANILQNYAERTKEKGKMLYIYNVNTKQENSYNICSCSQEKSNEVITKKIENLPQGSKLGSVLRRKDDRLVLDLNATKHVAKEINTMIKKKIKEQDQYLESKRIEGHIYEVGEKYSGRIWLYDLNNMKKGNTEGIEEIKFPKELYETAKQGEKYIFSDGKYNKTN